MYLDKINMLSDIYAPLKIIKKYKLKFKAKPSVTLGLQKSISVKNKLLKHFINNKDPILKEEFQKNIETCSPSLWRKVNRLIISILREIGIILRTYRMDVNTLSL